MVSFTELGDAPVKLALALTVFAWLLWRRARSAALHWLAALGFGLAITTLLKWLFQVPRPVATLYNGIFSYAFPSNHAAMTTILFGFLAVLVARELPPARRWLPYLGATLLVVLIAFSRLYLGAHWLTDTLGGISLGAAWVALLGLAYSRHRSEPLSYRGLLGVSLVAVLAADVGYGILHQEQELARYQPQPACESWPGTPGGAKTGGNSPPGAWIGKAMTGNRCCYNGLSLTGVKATPACRRLADTASVDLAKCVTVAESSCATGAVTGITAAP